MVCACEKRARQINKAVCAARREKKREVGREELGVSAAVVEYAGISTVKPVWSSSIPALCCCTLNVRRKLNSRVELKIDPALSDPRPASSTGAEKEVKPLLLLLVGLLLLASRIFWLVCSLGCARKGFYLCSRLGGSRQSPRRSSTINPHSLLFSSIFYWYVGIKPCIGLSDYVTTIPTHILSHFFEMKLLFFFNVQSLLVIWDISERA